MLCRSEVPTAPSEPLEYHDAREIQHERAHASNLGEVIVLPNAIEVPNAIELPEDALTEKEKELTALKTALDEKDGELTALKTALDKNNKELEDLRAQLRELRRDPPPGLWTPEEEDIVTQVRDMLAAKRDGGADGSADKRLHAEMQELLLRHNSCGSRNVSMLQDALPGRTPTAVRTVRRYCTRTAVIAVSPQYQNQRLVLGAYGSLVCAASMPVQDSAEFLPIQHDLARLLFEPTVRGSRVTPRGPHELVTWTHALAQVYAHMRVWAP